MGNVVYTDNISNKSVATYTNTIDNFQELKLFPNPVKDVLNIKYSGNRIREMEVEIFNITGRSVLHQKIQNIESGQNIGLNVHTLKNGMYLVKVIVDNQVLGVNKIIK